jgi:hypothetical protein
MSKRLSKIQSLERKFILLSNSKNEIAKIKVITELANEHVKQEKKKKRDAKLWFKINVSDAELEALHITKNDIADAPSWVLDTFILAIKKIKELQHNQFTQNFSNTSIQAVQIIHSTPVHRITPVKPTTTTSPDLQDYTGYDYIIASEEDEQNC